MGSPVRSLHTVYLDNRLVVISTIFLDGQVCNLSIIVGAVFKKK